MNIVTPIPTSIVFSNANVNTESARRDNLLRETIPQAASNESSEAKSGLGSESDRVRTPGQLNAPLVYEKPQANANNPLQGQNNNDSLPDNGQEQSAGKEAAEDRQEQAAAEQREVQELKQRDQEVRAHEQAHAAVGGQYASAPTYEYETGPDGKRYAVGGEVSIDIGEEASAEQTLRKMQQVKAAALAPAEPSPQDLRVASEATQKAFDARTDINEERAEELRRAQQKLDPEATPAELEPQIPDLEDIVEGIDISPPQRALDESLLANTQQETATLAENNNQQSESVLKAIDVIQSRYSNSTVTTQPSLSLSA